ncbi:Putative endoglucanase type F, partial [Leucoagaricus sp. SymC.cos]
CGGQGWSGATTCVSGWTCTYLNDWYSQCLPGGGGGSTTPPTTSTPGSPSSTTSSSGGTATLAPGYSWIRAVVDPNFHKYLRSEVINSASDAVLGEPTDAAQFQITNGQLVQAAGGKNLYATVEAYVAGSGQNKLKVSWSASPAATGDFSWSGDTLLWVNASVTRPQSNAWLVCPDAEGNKLLYVNLGPYGYQTPAGCADQTIHAYTGSTATV